MTLEPCNHHGRTPPARRPSCAAGVRAWSRRCADPNPRVAGGGVARLRRPASRSRRAASPPRRARQNRVFLTADARAAPARHAQGGDDPRRQDRRRPRRLAVDHRRGGPRGRRTACAAKPTRSSSASATVLPTIPSLDVRLDAALAARAVPRRARHARAAAREARVIAAGRPGARADRGGSTPRPPTAWPRCAARGATVLRCRARDGRVDSSALAAPALRARGAGPCSSRAAARSTPRSSTPAWWTASRSSWRRCSSAARAAPAGSAAPAATLKSALRLADARGAAGRRRLLIEADVRRARRDRTSLSDVHRDRRGEWGGVIERDGGRRLEVGAGLTLEGSELGASVAVNGACLTVVDARARRLRLRGRARRRSPRTALGDLRAGDAREPRATAPVRRPRGRPPRPGPRRRGGDRGGR